MFDFFFYIFINRPIYLDEWKPATTTTKRETTVVVIISYYYMCVC